MARAFLVVSVVAVVLAVYAFFDALATPRQQIRYLPKPGWIVAILLLPIVGPLAWIFWGTARLRPGPRRSRPPSGPRGPDDDPDYLRGL